MHMKKYSDTSDGDLLNFLKDNDEKALKELFDRFWKKLFVVALNRLSSAELAEECVQDVFLSIWNRRQDLQIEYSLATYLSAAVKYRSIRMLSIQFEKQQQFKEDTDLIENSLSYASDNVEAYLFEKEFMNDFFQAVAKLPQKCQLVYRMNFEQCKDSAEIAEELNLSQKTVQAHMTKAVKDIKEDLSKKYPLVLVSSFLLPFMH